MSIKNLTELLNKGVFNIFYTNEDGTLFVVCHFTDTTLYFVKVVENGKDLLYIPTKFSSHEDFLKEVYSVLQISYKLQKKGRLKVVSSDLPFNNLVLTSTLKVPVNVVPVGIGQLEEVFNAEGFDISALDKPINTRVARDYSKLLASSVEAQERIALADAILANKPLDDKYLAVADAIKYGEFNLVYLVGPSGTGKTILAWQLAHYCGAPMLSLQGSEGTTREDLIGYTDVKAEVKTDDGFSDNVSYAQPHDASQYTVVEGLLLKAYREGYHLVIDEANFMLPTVMSVINQMVDDTPTYEFKGKFIKRSPNFVLYLTSNQAYEGTNLYNPATKSRGITLELPKLNSEQFVSRMLSNNDKLSMDFYKELFYFQDIVQDYANRWGETSSVCIRHAMSFAKLITARPLKRDDFLEQFKIAYLNNCLSMDNNNSAKIADLLSNPDMVEALEKLYSFYDFRVLPEVEPTISFTEAFDAFDSDWEEATVEPIKTSVLDDEDFLDTFDEEDFK